MEAARVWVVDIEHWPRAYLLAELIERGYDGTGFETVRDAIVRLIMTPAERPALLVLDLHSQPADEKAFAALARQEIPILAIADATWDAGQGIGGRAWAAVLRRPTTIGAVADWVARIVGARERAQGDAAPTDAAKR
jgi:hypothetical protein